MPSRKTLPCSGGGVGCSHTCLATEMREGSNAPLCASINSASVETRKLLNCHAASACLLCWSIAHAGPLDWLAKPALPAGSAPVSQVRREAFLRYCVTTEMVSVVIPTLPVEKRFAAVSVLNTSGPGATRYFTMRSCRNWKASTVSGEVIVQVVRSWFIKSPPPAHTQGA